MASAGVFALGALKWARDHEGVVIPGALAVGAFALAGILHHKDQVIQTQRAAIHHEQVQTKTDTKVNIVHQHLHNREVAIHDQADHLASSVEAHAPDDAAGIVADWRSAVERLRDDAERARRDRSGQPDIEGAVSATVAAGG